MPNTTLQIAPVAIVSIHARQYWRAMPYEFMTGDMSEVFQSTPANTGGRCHHALVQYQLSQVSIHARQYWRAMQVRAMLRVLGWSFQSTPANTGGRCHPRNARGDAYRGFNPRPPILAGDAAAADIVNADS